MLWNGYRVPRSRIFNDVLFQQKLTLNLTFVENLHFSVINIKIYINRQLRIPDLPSAVGMFGYAVNVEDLDDGIGFEFVSLKRRTFSVSGAVAHLTH
jgi:hypothetical protein